jgi:hypothetical protein
LTKINMYNYPKELIKSVTVKMKIWPFLCLRTKSDTGTDRDINKIFMLQYQSIYWFTEFSMSVHHSLVLAVKWTLWTF